MTVTPMGAAHAAQIAVLERETFSLPWDEASIRAELDNPLSLWLVAAEGETVLGYVGSQTCFDDTDILNVAVRSDCRRQGIAEALMRELETRPSGRERAPADHAGGARVERPGHPPLREARLRSRGAAEGLLRKAPRGRADHAENLLSNPEPGQARLSPIPP